MFALISGGAGGGSPLHLFRCHPEGALASRLAPEGSRDARVVPRASRNRYKEICYEQS